VITHALVDEVLQLVSRVPVDRETHDIAKTSQLRQPPKWYQFKPRSLMERRWLSDLGNGLGHERNRLFLADEGGMGKTKAAALLVKKTISDNPAARILVLVEKRQVEDWYNELRMIMPRTRVISQGGASRLFEPRAGTVHIVRKGSLHHRFEDLRTKWNQKSPNFSLVVLDECHKNKRETGLEDFEQNQVERRNYDAEKLACSPVHTHKVLGLTASPLGIDAQDVQVISEKIGIPRNLFDFFKEENEEMWGDWGELATDQHYIRIREELVQSDFPPEHLVSEIDMDNWVEFADRYAKRLSKLLPVRQNEFIQAMRNFSPTNIAMVRTLFADLTPFAPIMSATLRDDLGAESNSIFRKRITINHPVDFTEITEQLDAMNGLKWKSRSILHGWIHERYDQPHGGSIRGFQLSGDLVDPRYKPLIEYMVESYDSGKDASCRCGTTIFVENTFSGRRLRSFENELRKDWVEHGPRDVYLNVHLIDGDTEDADFILQSLRNKPTNVAEYDVVIGTAAIEQGVNMEWADLIVHWDFSPTAQKLDQRTWRLDRHLREGIMSEFKVIYFLTGDPAQTRVIDRIRVRAREFDKMLGRSFVEGFWPSNPLPDDPIIHDRIYVDSTSGEFLHPESLSISRVWSTTPRSEGPQSQIYFQQQYALVRWLSESVGFDIDNTILQNSGQIVRQKANGNDLQCWQLSLRQMSYLASGPDLETLLEWSSMENQRETWLAIDGSERPENTEVRYRMVSIDPIGNFIGRLRRRNPTNRFVARECSEGENNCAIVSIDPVSEQVNNLSNTSVELEQILDKFPRALRSNGNLFVVDGNALCRVELGKHETLLLRLFNSTADELVTMSEQDFELNNREILLTNFLQDLLKQLQSSIEQYVDDIKASEEILKQIGDPDTLDQARIQSNLHRKKRHLEQSVNEMDRSLNPIRQHLGGKAVFTLNVRYVEVMA
jgi:hypothetical protein